MDANKQRGQGWSSSEMPMALLVTLSAPRLCSPTLGCTCRNTCFLVCVQYWGGSLSSSTAAPPSRGEPTMRWVAPGECVFGIFRSRGACFSSPSTQTSGSEGTGCRHASGGSLPLLPVHLRGFSDWPVPTSRGFTANLGTVISLLR